MVLNFDVRAIWRSVLSARTPLFYVTILATLCIKGLMNNDHFDQLVCSYTSSTHVYDRD